MCRDNFQLQLACACFQRLCSRRPITAFIEGYPGVKADPSWTPLLTTPNHPEYPSGHQVTVGAILEVLLRTLGGKDNVSRCHGIVIKDWVPHTVVV